LLRAIIEVGAFLHAAEAERTLVSWSAVGTMTQAIFPHMAKIAADARAELVDVVLEQLLIFARKLRFRCRFGDTLSALARVKRAVRQPPVAGPQHEGRNRRVRPAHGPVRTVVASAVNLVMIVAVRTPLARARARHRPREDPHTRLLRVRGRVRVGDRVRVEVRLRIRVWVWVKVRVRVRVEVRVRVRVKG